MGGIIVDEKLVLKEFFPKLYNDKAILSSFLEKHDLKYEDDIEFAIGLYEEEEMVACGCCSGALLKDFAVEERYRGQNILGRIISVLVQNRFESGYFEPIVITRPSNKTMFENSGFFPIAETADLVFLEHNRNGIQQYISKLGNYDNKIDKAGGIVVNCNPFTLGHRYLIEYASSHCDRLHIFVVEEERSDFPFEVRLDLVKKGVGDLFNVHVHKGDKYIISSATFPSYFLKKEDDVVEMQARLDATLFATKIAPALGIKKRFVGTEPKCIVTNKYNKVMKEVLPEAGIEVIEIPRIQSSDGEVISASRVRNLLKEGCTGDELRKLVPKTTYEFLSRESEAIIKKLRHK